MNPRSPADLSSPPAPKASARRFIVLGALILTCFAMRLTGLLSLPIFGDEAIYLRWAQLVRGEGVASHQWWVALADPKPPLHIWILALFFRWGANPLWSGRMLSILCAAASIPPLVKICQELRRLPRPIADADSAGWAWGLVAAILFIFCPFLGFHQRMATAESLFLLESLLVVWLSLRWGRLSSLASPWSPQIPPARATAQSWITAIALGLFIGAMLMTRQGISYTLCILPILGRLLHLPAKPIASTTESPTCRGPLTPVLQFTTIMLIALFLWSPYLLAQLSPRALETAGMVPGTGASPSAHDIILELKRRIFYQDNFTQADSHLAVAARNFQNIFLPHWNAAGDPTSGWLFLYLTPIVFFLCLAGMLYLLVPWKGRLEWRIPLFLFAWLALTLGPVILLGNVTFSRYILPAVPPLLIAGAWLLLELSNALMRGASALQTSKASSSLHWLAVIALWIAVIAWPMKAMATQASRWWQQTLTLRDRYQYVTGWTAGYGTQAAIDYLQNLASVGPIVVITDGGWGTPADAAWIYLSNNPNIQLLYTLQSNPILTPAASSAAPDTFLLRRDKWLFTSEVPVALPQAIPVLYLTNDPVHAATDLPADEFLREHNPNLQLARSFKGVEINGRPEGENVDLFMVPHAAPAGVTIIFQP